MRLPRRGDALRHLVVEPLDRGLHLPQAKVGVGARPQRLLFASTGTKDKNASDVLYINALAAPNTVNTMPEETLLAFGDHGKVSSALPRDGGDYQAVLEKHLKAGIDLTALSTKLQSDGANSFIDSWNELLAGIESKSKVLA